MPIHNINPIYNSESKILILGSFPSVKSREGQFFYDHPRNRFWKTLALVLGNEEPLTHAQKKTFLLKHHIALWDVLASCEIKGSSDSSIHLSITKSIHFHIPVCRLSNYHQQAPPMLHILLRS